MGKFDGVLLAADYDDTLYDTKGTISPENRAAIESFIAEGGLFTISTGRSYVNFAIQMELEKVPVNVPVVLSNGSTIYDFARDCCVWHKDLSRKTAAHLTQVCDKFPEVGFEAYHGDGVYTFRANAATEKHLKRCHLTGIPRAIEDIPTPWVKVILQHMDSAYLEEIRQYILAQWPGMYEATFSNPYLLELTAKGANKGLAVKRLADSLGIEADHLYCVGNGLNDIPMLEVAAMAFAPDNCYDEVKQWGAHILPSCDDHCIARLIEHLEKRYE